MMESLLMNNNNNPTQQNIKILWLNYKASFV